MKRLIFSVSALLTLMAPALAQRQPNLIKQTTTKYLAKRDAKTMLPARSPVPVDVAQPSASKSTRTVGMPNHPLDSVRLVSSPAQPASTDNIVPVSLAVRTSPEVPIHQQNIIRSYYVDLAYNKTVSIIFPAAVRSVDLGSRSIMPTKRPMLRMC